MLALSPLTTSNDDHEQRIDAAGGFSDPFLRDEVDFLDSIDFTGIIDGYGLDAIADLPELQLAADILDHSSAGGEQQACVPQESLKQKTVISAPSPVSSRGRKPEAAKSSHGKKKVKVDWTPELHRRFVQAVEQLGVDKAVPSRILELMGINNLTRHNVASHLQKYRSHWKHLLGREAEAAARSCGRQLHRVGPKKENSSSWISPTLGFPRPPLLPPFRPLHVWGHPTVDHRPPMLPAMWPGNGMPLQFQAPQWPPQPPNYIAYWQPHYKEGSREGWGPAAALQPLPAFVTGIPPHTMYRPPHWVPPLQQHPGLQAEFSVYPSKESIDAAIEDVLAKPRLPLPLGLKPPSTESVLVELQRQGVPKVPPSASNSEGK